MTVILFAVSPLNLLWDVVGLNHSMIDFKLDVRTNDIEGHHYKMNTVESLKYYWHNADFRGLQQSLSQVDWNTFVCFNANATSVRPAFLNTVWDSIKECVPHNGASHSNGIVNKRTRRPASADRTARAANFRRDLEAT